MAEETDPLQSMTQAFSHGAPHPDYALEPDPEPDPPAESTESAPPAPPEEGAEPAGDPPIDDSETAAFPLDAKDFQNEDAALDYLAANFSTPTAQAPAPQVASQPASQPQQPAGYDLTAGYGDDEVRKAALEARALNEETRRALEENKQVNQTLRDQVTKNEYWGQFYDAYRDLKGHEVLVQGIVEKYRPKLSAILPYKSQQFIAQAARTYLKRLDRMPVKKRMAVSTKQEGHTVPTSQSKRNAPVAASKPAVPATETISMVDLLKKSQRELKGRHNAAYRVDTAK